MRRLRTLSTRRLLAALLALGALVAGGGIAQAALSGSADAPPPKPLDRAVRDALAAAPRVAGVSARVEFANGLLPGGSLPRGAATPLATGASGRVWIAADGRARLELQSSAGDTQIAVDDDGYRIYDAGAQTVYTLPAPQRHAERPAEGPSQAAVDRGLSRLTEAWTLSQPRPGTTAGRPSYTVRIAPKDDGGLLGAGELAWDAAHGVPLRAAVYAQGSADPVLELEATEVRYGAVSAADLAVKAPAGTRTVEIDPPVGRGAGAKAAPVRGRDAVAAAVPFALAAPARLGGLERTGVRLTRSGGEAGALVTYGERHGRDRRARAARRHGRRRARRAREPAPAGSTSTAPPGPSWPRRSGRADVRARRRPVHDRGAGPARRGGERGAGARMSAPPIEARGLVKRYGELTAVDGIDLTVEAGDVYGYLGPNGAGKTTSLRMLLGLIRPDDGAARLFGRDPQEEGARALDGVAGFVEAPRFYPYLSGRRNLELVAALDGGDATARIDDALDTVDLADRAGDKAGGYSHGMRQRLGIAGALLRDPRLLLLDEPTTGLDPAGMRDMRRLIRRLAGHGITVLLSSHVMGEVEELCDRVAIVRGGRMVYEGALADLIRQTGGRYALRTTDDAARGRRSRGASTGSTASRTATTAGSSSPGARRRRRGCRSPSPPRASASRRSSRSGRRSRSCSSA